MPETKIGSAIAGVDKHTDYSVDTQQTDGIFDQPETRWENQEWTQNYGYYTDIPEVQTVIDAKATWTIGKGFKADEVTTMLLDTIKGWGKDTFNTILENAIRTMHISGDSYLHIIRDAEENLINLKPLDPGVMVHIVGRNGIIKRYEQNSKIVGNDPKKYKPDEIFHLVRNRVADNIHGTSMVKVLANIILMKNEAMADWKRVLHRNVDPVWIIHMDTDDETEMAAFKTKMDKLRGDNEQNLYVPKDVIVPELMSVAPNANLTPLTWIDSLDDKFYQAAGVPKFIVGGLGGLTEAAVKIGYLAFQQSTEEHQLQIEEQVLSQLNLVIELEFPASLEGDLLSDKAKDKTEGAAQPNDTTAGVGK